MEQGKTLRLGLREFLPLLVVLLMLLLFCVSSDRPLMVMTSLCFSSTVPLPYISSLWRFYRDLVSLLEPSVSPPIPLCGFVVTVVLSFDVTQCRTNTQKRISALQHMRQIQPGSPFSTIRMVRLTTEVVRVAREPMSERLAMRWSVGFALFWYE
jgi:hypothetical protein